MPRVNLTDAFCRSAKAINGSLTEYSDMKERGLALRVTPGGVKSWTFRYRNQAGEQKRVSLGRLDDVPLVKARAVAAVERGGVHEGEDPSRKRKAVKTKALIASKLETVQEIGERYFIEAEAGRHRPNARKKRASTLVGERRYFNRHVVPAFGKEHLADLTRARIQAFVNDVADDHSPSAARQARVVLQGIFTFAARQELVATNPCQFVTVPRFEARERVLTDAELRSVWKAFAGVAGIEKLYIGRSVALAVMLAAVTVQRRGEVTGMRRVEINREQRLWTIPGGRTKNHRTHVVPLSDLALRLVDEAIGSAGQSQFVFPSPRNTEKPIEPAALSHAWRRLLPHAGFGDEVPDIRPHDLRRTGATNMTGERIGIPRFTVSKVLNHTSDTGDSAAVTAVYDRNAYLAEKRRALDAWAALLLEIVEDRQRAANIARIGGQRD